MGLLEHPEHTILRSKHLSQEDQMPGAIAGAVSNYRLDKLVKVCGNRLLIMVVKAHLPDQGIKWIILHGRKEGAGHDQSLAQDKGIDH